MWRLKHRSAPPAACARARPVLLVREDVLGDAGHLLRGQLEAAGHVCLEMPLPVIHVPLLRRELPEVATDLSKNALDVFHVIAVRATGSWNSSAGGTRGAGLL